MLFPTTIVGSFPQPEWLIDRAKLAGAHARREAAGELGAVDQPLRLRVASDDGGGEQHARCLQVVGRQTPR